MGELRTTTHLEVTEVNDGRPIKAAQVIKFDSACSCGDSLQTVEVMAPDHGKRRKLYVAWCMDCLSVRGWAVEKGEGHG